jgi:DNA repair protein RadC
MSIRQWPSAERPRERLLARGPHALGDAELLAVLLGSGVRGKDAVTLGRELLVAAGGLTALLGKASAPGLPGLGPAKRARLTAAMELARRTLREDLERGEPLRDPLDSFRTRSLPACTWTTATAYSASRSCSAAPSTVPACMHAR